MSLLGAGWGQWCGAWTSHRVLEERDGRWSLREDGQQTAQWPDFAAAMETLWPERSRRDASPWLLGWAGYEACAAIAGSLPARPAKEGLPGAWWLVKPRRCEEQAAVSGQPADGPRSASLDDHAFAEQVGTIRERIAAGDVYQVNLTRRFSVHGWRGGLAPLLAAVADSEPPEYLCWSRSGDHELVCASMEMLLRRRGRDLETAPIKGTRPRGKSAEQDNKLALELDSDGKERAELAMIVDLERNDLGRVAEPGSVMVEDPGNVYRYATVLHRVARVRALLAEGLQWWQVLAAMVPGGSVTGCPKIAAMEVISELETVSRGPYTGALGVVAGNGDMELALPIRTAFRSGDSTHFAAGCGIVWQSEASSEELESRLKVQRWLHLCGWGAQ